jgi:hypothetical protein
LDSDLTQVLKNVDTAYPSVTNVNYIRYEYFATHSANLMRVPQIAQKLASKWDIRNDSGERLPPESLVEPGKMKLIFSNAGQGVKIEWITDSQLFNVIGFAQDPERAVAYSKDYAEAFMEENVEQLRVVMTPLAERFRKLREDIYSEMDSLDAQASKIKMEYHVADPSTENSEHIKGKWTT